MIIRFLIIAVFMMISIFCYDGDYKYPRTFLLNALACILIGVTIWIDGLPLLSIFVTYMLLSGCYHATWPMLNHPASHFKKKNFIFMHQVSINYIEVLSPFIIFAIIPDNVVMDFFYVMPVIAIIGMVLSFIYYEIPSKRVNREVTIFGIAGNQSVSSTLLSLISIASLGSTLPYHLNIIGFIAALIGSIKMNGFIGILGSFLGILVYFSYFYPIYVLIFCAVLIVFCAIFAKKENKSDVWPWWTNYKIFNISLGLSTRDKIWDFAIKKYIPVINKLFGTGMGTFTYMFPAFDMKNRKDDQGIYKNNPRSFLMWLHNDILQVFTEIGLIGIIIAVFVCFEVISISYSSPFMMAFLACSFINLLGNFPTKMAPDTLILTMFAKYLTI